MRKADGFSQIEKPVPGRNLDPELQEAKSDFCTSQDLHPFLGCRETDRSSSFAPSCGVEGVWEVPCGEAAEGSRRGILLTPEKACKPRSACKSPHLPSLSSTEDPSLPLRMADPRLPRDSYQICRSLSGWRSGPWGCSSLRSCPRQCGRTSCLSENSM